MNKADRTRLVEIRRRLEQAQDESERQWAILRDKIDGSLDPKVNGHWPELTDYQAWSEARAKVDAIGTEFEEALQSVRPGL